MNSTVKTYLISLGSVAVWCAIVRPFRESLPVAAWLIVLGGLAVWCAFVWAAKRWLEPLEHRGAIERITAQWRLREKKKKELDLSLAGLQGEEWSREGYWCCVLWSALVKKLKTDSCRGFFAGAIIVALFWGWYLLLLFGSFSIAMALLIMMFLIMAVPGLMGHEQKPEEPPILEGIKCEQTVSKGPDLSEAIEKVERD
jgi:hypothetical protein